MPGRLIFQLIFGFQKQIAKIGNSTKTQQNAMKLRFDQLWSEEFEVPMAYDVISGEKRMFKNQKMLIISIKMMSFQMTTEPLNERICSVKSPLVTTKDILTLT